MTRWEIVRLILILILYGLFMQNYFEFKKCIIHTHNFSYCVYLPDGDNHQADDHKQILIDHEH